MVLGNVKSYALSAYHRSATEATTDFYIVELGAWSMAFPFERKKQHTAQITNKFQNLEVPG